MFFCFISISFSQNFAQNKSFILENPPHNSDSENNKLTSSFHLHCIDSSQHCTVIDSLEFIYGQNKQIPEKYKLAILIALSYYPELIETPITFKESFIKTTLNARPTISSLCLKNKSKRSYVVRINNSQKEGMITIDEVPFNASIGIFAHEFSHFVDYQNRNFRGVLKRLWAYTSKKRKAIYEKEIDSMTVARGLKWQMYDWSYYAIFQSKASDSYKLFKKNTYLKPKEIIEQTQEKIQQKQIQIEK
ncbi:hypothetical protein [Bernardetia litoralis]|uniref:hypothetical protein n=1 Tax=Bernardetia litoralis TaxID=999 RepID=UPI0006944542|nr:hypothetical protein [Bernardetia litoralis]